MNRLKISQRLALLTGALALLLVAFAGWTLRAYDADALQQRRDLLQGQVQSALGVLEWAHARETAGLPTAQAQQSAKEAIERMRYGSGGYFILSDLQGQVLMHPISPKLNGTDGNLIVDPQGGHPFTRVADTARTQGAGFTSYWWPKPGQTRPVPKLTYVAAFAPWGWSVASGAYLDDLRAEFWRQAARVGAALAVVLVAAGVIGQVVARSISARLADAVRVARDVADGDLSQPIAAGGHDEVASVLQALATMRERLAGMVSAVHRHAQSVSNTSAQIATGNNDLSQRTGQQSGALQETAASLEQLSATVRQNADNAQQADTLAKGASGVAQRGGEVVGRVVTTMHEINDSSKRIADIIGVIDGIAFQTNILALNAAVEAARAGEQGRGFAVVAAEVRSLAQRSADAAREIKSLISASVERVEKGGALVDEAGRTMTEVVGAIGRVTEIMSEISVASHQQSGGVAQVGQAVAQMDRSTQSNAALVEQSAASAVGLSRQAAELVEAVGVFRLV